MTDFAIMNDEADTGRQPEIADGIKLTELQAKRRRQRNVAIGLALFGFVALFYVITLIKLGAGAHH
jgi:hypothetical protein